MNLLEPDVATIGNHEVDYGFSHLLFIEKCAEFPIINANMYLTVLLTHIGFDKDQELAADLAKDCPVDIIIGGYSHTHLDEPCVVEGIPIVQAAVGTAQIGRFDILFDEFFNRIDSYTWRSIPITEENCPRDEALEDLIGSGNIRGFTLGPIVTLQDFVEAFPYENSVIGVHMTGAQLRQAMQHLMRDDAIAENTQCDTFQYSKGFFCEYDSGSHTILQLKMNGKDVQDDDVYLVAMERYYYNCMEQALGIKPEEVEKNGPAVQLAGETANVLEEYLMSHDFPKKDTEPRLVIHA